MALDAVIFDVDGTLIDTNAAHAKAWHIAFKNCGFEIPEDRIAPEIGKGGDNLIPAILGDSAAKAHQQALDKAYAAAFLKIAAQEKFVVFNGAAELMKAISARGLKVAIATSAKKEYLQAIEKSSGLWVEEFCDVLVTADDAEHSKPAPDIVLASVEKLQLSPAQCLMIGDTPHDSKSCRHAGVVCIGVLSGGNSEEVLLGSGARRVYQDTAALLSDLDDALKAASPGEAHLSREAQESLMREALEVAEDGMRNGEVPIGSIIARGDGTVIARGYNEFNKTQNKTAHAEMVAFAGAAGKYSPEDKGLILVSTLEPCVMCTGAAMEAAIDTIIYGLKAPADNGTQRVQSPESPESQMPRIVGEVLPEKSRALFEKWLSQNEDSPQADFVRQLLERA